MSLMHVLVQELESEALATRALLSRVPEHRLDWRPHRRCVSLGELASHIAENPARISEILAVDAVSLPDFEMTCVSSRRELLDTLDASLERARAALTSMADEEAMTVWRLVHEGHELMDAPKVGLVRMLMLNHWYDHRGQLTVYLRLLDVPLPSAPGPLADKSPFEMH